MSVYLQPAPFSPAVAPGFGPFIVTAQIFHTQPALGECLMCLIPVLQPALQSLLHFQVLTPSGPVERFGGVLLKVEEIVWAVGVALDELEEAWSNAGHVSPMPDIQQTPCSPGAAEVDERPGAGHFAHGHFDDGGTGGFETLADGPAQFVGGVGAQALGAKGLGQPYEVGVV